MEINGILNCESCPFRTDEGDLMCELASFAAVALALHKGLLHEVNGSPAEVMHEFMAVPVVRHIAEMACEVTFASHVETASRTAVEAVA